MSEKGPGTKPDVKEVEELVGFDISADYRDELWKEHEAAEVEKREIVLNAVKELSAENPDKKPDVKDVEKVVGFDISAEYRDEIWKEHKAAQ